MTSHTLHRNGYSLSTLEYGEGDPVVLLHGFPFDGVMWDAQIAALQETYRVIVPDLRGFGTSTLAADDVGAGVDMRSYADDVAAALDEMGVDQPLTLAGFSMGGYVAWQFALHYRDRLRALILCDTRAAADAPEAQHGREKMAEACLDNRSSAPALEMLPKLLAPETLEQRPEVVDAVREMIERASPQAIAAAQRGMARREDVRHLLGEIDVPALCLVGRYDVISPIAEMQDMAATLPQGELVEIPAAGHMTVIENADAVSDAILAFLQQ
ncbi:MAG: alpha/beta hydrolase [Planctomycetales bacterium]|nr:alpha/beta hydrolase [Planctomycetales bacterium]